MTEGEPVVLGEVMEKLVEELAAKRQQKLERLEAVCLDFIKDNEVTCAEKIMQDDLIQLAAPELVEAICEILGYAKAEE